MHTLLVFPGRTISGVSIPVVRTPHTAFPALLCSDFLESGWRVNGCVFRTPARLGCIAVPHCMSYRDPCTVSRALTPFSQMRMACAGSRCRPCASVIGTALSLLSWPGRSPVMALAPPCQTGLCWQGTIAVRHCIFYLSTHSCSSSSPTRCHIVVHTCAFRCGHTAVSNMLHQAPNCAKLVWNKPPRPLYPRSPSSLWFSAPPFA